MSGSCQFAAFGCPEPDRKKSVTICVARDRAGAGRVFDEKQFEAYREPGFQLTKQTLKKLPEKLNELVNFKEKIGDRDAQLVFPDLLTHRPEDVAVVSEISAVDSQLNMGVSPSRVTHYPANGCYCTTHAFRS